MPFQTFDGGYSVYREGLVYVPITTREMRSNHRKAHPAGASSETNVLSTILRYYVPDLCPNVTDFLRPTGWMVLLRLQDDFLDICVLFLLAASDDKVW